MVPRTVDCRRVAGDDGVSLSKQTVKARAFRELKEFFGIALYLWLVFSLLILFKASILAEHHIDFAFHGLAIINALALAKVMLVARDLRVGERFNDAPLIYPTLLKCALFTIILACFKILEDGIVGHLRGKSFRQSLADFGGGTVQVMQTLSLLMFVVLIPFFGCGELQRVLGQGKFQELFFHPFHPHTSESRAVEAHIPRT